MSINLNTIRTLDAGKSYYFSNSTGEIKEASLWQKFKCYTGLGDGREKVRRLNEAIKKTLLTSANIKEDVSLNH